MIDVLGIANDVRRMVVDEKRRELNSKLRVKRSFLDNVRGGTKTLRKHNETVVVEVDTSEDENCQFKLQLPQSPFPRVLRIAHQ